MFYFEKWPDSLCYIRLQLTLDACQDACLGHVIRLKAGPYKYCLTLGLRVGDHCPSVYILQSVPRQNVDHYSVPILSKPVYCEILQDTPLFTDSDSA